MKQAVGVRQTEQGSGTGLDGKSPKILRVRRKPLMVLPLLAAMLLSSCTSTTSTIDTAAASMQPQLNSTAPADPAKPGIAPPPVEKTMAGESAPDGQTQLVATTSNDTSAKAETAASEISVAAAGAEATEGVQVAAAAIPAPSDTLPKAAELKPAPAPIIAITEAPAVNPDQIAVANAAAGEGDATQQVQVASAEPSASKKAQELTASPQVLENASNPSAVKKPRKTLFSSMFGDSSQKAAKKQTAPDQLPAATQLALAPEPTKQAAMSAAAAEIEPTKLKLTNEAVQTDLALSAPSVDNGDLPGVRKGALFEIKRRDSLDSDADIDIGETDSGPILLASAAGLGRLAPNGLKVQRESVDVACLKPQLVRMLKKIEAHYSRPVIVTSGYRSPSYNRRVRGAKNSLHMYCAAADIQVSGVGKWEMARYLRSMPGRGGVGTYCHTESVHVDVGPDRDWNWRCSRRK